MDITTINKKDTMNLKEQARLCVMGGKGIEKLHNYDIKKKRKIY